MVRKVLIAVALVTATVAIIAAAYFGQRPIPPLSRTIKYPPSDLSRHTSLCIAACRTQSKDKIAPVLISVTNEDETPLTIRSDQVFAATKPQAEGRLMPTI